jgi:hypothetical protein
MKIKNTRTSQTSKTKPVSRAKVVIAKITAVRIPDKFTKETRMSAQGFLKDVGFITKPSKYGFIDAVSPAGEEMIFYAEYEPPKGGSFTPFRMVRLHRGTPRVLDKGTIHMVISRSDDGPIDFTAEGDDVEGWEFVAEMTSLEEMPDRGSYVIRESSDDSDANGRYSDLPNSVHAGPPTTSEVMIADILARRKREMVRASEYQGENPLVTAANKIKIPENWPYNNLILRYMDKYHGGDHTVSAISDALFALIDGAGANVSYLVNLFNENLLAIQLLLAIHHNLHPDLKPLLDNPRGTSDWVSSRALGTLVKIPLDKQVKLWKEAKGTSDPKHVTKCLDSLAADYVKAFGNKCIWLPNNIAEKNVIPSAAP